MALMKSGPVSSSHFVDNPAWPHAEPATANISNPIHLRTKASSQFHAMIIRLRPALYPICIV
jgi:hypothetical protein